MNQSTVALAYKKQSWLAEVASCIDRLPNQFTLGQVYSFKDELSAIHPENHTIEASVRKVLQNIRDDGHIVFHGRGNYEKSASSDHEVTLTPDDSSDPFIAPESPADDPDQKIWQAIRQRRGQPKFRQALLQLYGGKCAVTGHGPKDVLEAAHIQPHSEEGRNSVDNGLLLRADIHTLFDLHLMSINPATLTVATSSQLAGTEYANFEGGDLRERIDGSEANQTYLTEHFTKLK